MNIRTLAVAEFAVGTALSIIAVLAYNVSATVSCAIAIFGIAFIMNSITLLVDGE